MHSIHIRLGAGYRVEIARHPTVAGVLAGRDIRDVTTLANRLSGHFRIYRVPHTGICFLNSGTFLRHLVARSQLWCVDGISKFVLKVGPTSFYRIEFPPDSADDKEKIEEFKAAVTQILQFEKTPSPFVTGQLEADERPVTPVRRQSLQPRERAKKWQLNKIWEPEDADHRARLRSSSGNRAVEGIKRRHLQVDGTDSNDSDDAASINGSDERNESGDAGSTSEVESLVGKAMAKLPIERPQSPVLLPKPLVIPRRTNYARSFTVPLRQTAPVSPLLPAASIVDAEPDKEPDAISIVSSHDSFHTIDDAATSPSETASFVSAKSEQEDDLTRHSNIIEQFAALQAPSHSRCTSRTLSMPNTPRPTKIGRAEQSDPSTPALISDSDDEVPDTTWADAITPPDGMRLRRLNRRMSGVSQRPALEPLPHPSALFKQSKQPRTMSSALIQKTYSILMGPPTHLVAMMLRIAARIVQGLPIIYSPHPGEKMAGSWESSASEEDEWDEDDYGIPLSGLRRTSEATTPALSVENVEPQWDVE